MMDISFGAKHTETNTTHKLAQTEWVKLKNWTVDHRCKGKDEIGSISLTFSQTGIGEAITAICSCGAKSDLTDYSLW